MAEIMNNFFNIMSTVVNILIALFAFGVMIFVHEIGHLVAAKLNKIRVNSFAIGMGPTLFKFKKGETEYHLKLLPIGGYCQMEGEDAESEDERAFNKKKVWRRVTVIVGGALMNILLGFIILIIMYAPAEAFYTTTIAAFAKDAKSESTGLKVGDRIISVNKSAVWSYLDIDFNILRDADAKVDFEVVRDGEKVALNGVTFDTQSIEGGKNVFVKDFGIASKEKTFFGLIKEAGIRTVSIVRLVWASLFDMITGRYGLNEMSGPIGTINATAQSVNFGWQNFLFIVALITINLGTFNLLPIPALDGGRLVFLAIEAIRRKPIKPEYEGYVHMAGFALLILLIVVVSFNDVLQLIRG